MSSDFLTPILVTGANGFIGSHVVKTLLERGYTVRGTVRPFTKKDSYKNLYELTNDPKKLHLVEADIMDPKAWEDAVKGCKYVIHTACPNLSYDPSNEDVLIKPAVEGTLNVLNAGLQGGITKSVITSSIGTMWLGNHKKEISEQDWLDESKCDSFHKSKALAERAIWNFWSKNKENMEVVIINPGFTVGPVLTKSKSASIEMILKLITGKVPALPNFSFAMADVKDVAEAHVNALFAQNSNGKRYLIASQTSTFEKIASVIRAEFQPYGYNIPSKTISTQYFKYIAWFDSGARKTMPYLDKDMKFNNSLSIKDLGLKYRSPEQALIEMCYSMIDLNMITNKIRAQTASR